MIMRASGSMVFLLRLVPRVRGGRWLCGAAIFVVLLALFWLSGIFAEAARVQGRGSFGAALFFCVMLAYIVPIFDFISERTEAALLLLRPHLGTDDAEFARWHQRIRVKPGQWLLVTLLVGNLGWVIHTTLLFGSVPRAVAESAQSWTTAATVLGTVATHLIVTLVLGALIDNALLLRRLAARVSIDVLCPQWLRPFASVSVISTLSIIGAQAAFPIMFVDPLISSRAYLPGMIATGLPMFFLAALPVWPVHTRMSHAKQQELEGIERRIARVPRHERPSAVQDLAPLLTYRREILEAPEWPFDQGVVTRLALYLIIPPLTWVGAALIENVVDAFV